MWFFWTYGLGRRGWLFWTSHSGLSHASPPLPSRAKQSPLLHSRTTIQSNLWMPPGRVFVCLACVIPVVCWPSSSSPHSGRRYGSVDSAANGRSDVESASESSRHTSRQPSLESRHSLDLSDRWVFIFSFAVCLFFAEYCGSFWFVTWVRPLSPIQLWQPSSPLQKKIIIIIFQTMLNLNPILPGLRYPPNCFSMLIFIFIPLKKACCSQGCILFTTTPKVSEGFLRTGCHFWALWFSAF